MASDASRDPVGTFLAAVRKNWEVWGDGTATPALLAVVEAVLALADEWEDVAAIECPDIAIREAISAALLGEGNG